MALAKDIVEIPALGRPFQLGMLYDCCKDALIPGRNQRRDGGWASPAGLLEGGRWALPLMRRLSPG